MDRVKIIEDAIDMELRLQQLHHEHIEKAGGVPEINTNFLAIAIDLALQKNNQHQH